MTAVLTVLALLGVLIVGLIAGLAWRGAVFIGDQRTLNRLSAQLEAERRMAAVTHATLAAMRRAAYQHRPGSERR